MAARTDSGSPARLTLPRRMRITRGGRFDDIFAARMRHAMGPLTVFCAPNGLDHPRLGLAVPRSVGNAVRRNRIKRLLREAFRLSQHDLPAGYDFIVQVRAHEPMAREAYRERLLEAAETLERKWKSRQRRSQTSDENTHEGA